MKSALSLILLWTALSLAGCKSNANQQLLERDLRQQEDKIYQLQGELDDCRQSLDSCRRENAALKKEGGSDGKSNDQDLPKTGAPPTIEPGEEGRSEKPGLSKLPL